LRSHPLAVAAVLVILSVTIPFMPASMLFAAAAMWVAVRWRTPLWATLLIGAYTIITTLEFLFWLSQRV
jgi:uncharacterized protein (DUF983 family)